MSLPAISSRLYVREPYVQSPVAPVAAVVPAPHVTPGRRSADIFERSTVHEALPRVTYGPARSAYT